MNRLAESCMWDPSTSIRGAKGGGGGGGRLSLKVYTGLDNDGPAVRTALHPHQEAADEAQREEPDRQANSTQRKILSDETHLLQEGRDWKLMPTTVRTRDGRM